MNHNKNATDLLRELMQQRNWHGLTDKPSQKKAAMDKTLAMQGRLSYEKSCQWLVRLGYKKIKEETWQ